MPRSVLDAIKEGLWDYEPTAEQVGETPGTTAMPGTSEKLHVLAERLARGLPLWSPTDRRSYDDGEEAT